jgi:hypothetical protein
LRLRAAGTERVYFTRHGRPLLSVGTVNDKILWLADDAFDYRRWTEWATRHGMNHTRALIPLSWRNVVTYSTANGGSIENVRLPYVRVSGSLAAGDPRFDLTRFDPDYWAFVRQRLLYLQEKGVVVHLVLWVNLDLRDRDTTPGDHPGWPGHFFNPRNNVNVFTRHLGGELANRFAIHHSVADGRQELAEAQRALIRKVVEVTHGLDNVYFDLVHELAEHYRDWPKVQLWIDDMARTARSRWDELQPDRPMLLGMDVGGLDEVDGPVDRPPPRIDWIFTRPYFDLLIYGKQHHAGNAIGWRRHYRKPYVGQEGWDDDDTKYWVAVPEQRVHARKFLWKFVMARCQQLDLYPRRKGRWPHTTNFDPQGASRLEEDTRVLRAFFDSLVDYPNLWFDGRVEQGPGAHRLVLSSAREAVAYVSSATGRQGVRYGSSVLRLHELALDDGSYRADVVAPARGPLETRELRVVAGSAVVPLPAFIDDLAVHVWKPPNGPKNSTPGADMDP